MKQIIITVLIFLSFQHSIAQNTFPSTGYVGIGTEFPSAPLDVNGHIQSTGGFYIPYTNGALFQAGSYHTRLRGGYAEYIDLGGPAGNRITLKANEIYSLGTCVNLGGIYTNLIKSWNYVAGFEIPAGITIASNWVNNGSSGPNYGSTLAVGDENINTAAGITNELSTITCNPIVNTLLAQASRPVPAGYLIYAIVIVLFKSSCKKRSLKF